MDTDPVRDYRLEALENRMTKLENKLDDKADKVDVTRIGEKLDALPYWFIGTGLTVILAMIPLALRGGH